MHNIPIGIYSRASPEAFRIVVILHPLGLHPLHPFRGQLQYALSSSARQLSPPVSPPRYAYCHRLLSFTVFPTDVIPVSLPTMNRISLEATDLPSIIGQGVCSSSQKVAPVADDAQCAELPGIP